MKTVGFIGGGMMASAIIEGMIRRMKFPPEKIFVSELNAERRDALREKYDVNAADGVNDFINKIDTLILAVKPQAAHKALADAAPKTPGGTLIASIVAGLTISAIESYFNSNPVIRIMPNTPLSVGCGMSAYAPNSMADDDDIKTVREILDSCGKSVRVSENMLDAVTGLSGSGPAYAFLVIDALSDGGVAAGLPRDVSTMLAAQTLLGAAKMVIENGKHPDELRDQVASPAGTTIAGVRVLEERAVRGAVIDAVIAASERSRELGKS